MTRVPFPHILDKKNLQAGKTFLRVVTDQDLETGSHIASKDEKPGFFLVWVVVDITEKRKAKGDWSKWPLHPFFYEMTTKFVGSMPSEEAQKYLS